MFNVCDYGAAGIARASEELELRNLDYCWFHYAPGLKKVIYHPLPDAEYDSVGLQKAIDTAHEAGGGTVLVPAGDYLIAPIELKSRVTLHLEPGATLWGSPYLKDYAPAPDADIPSYTHERGYNRAQRNINQRVRLISAHGANHVSITGSGTINAQSCAWVFPWMNGVPESWQSLQRPSDTIIFHRCESVVVEGIELVDTLTWSIVFDSCHYVRVRGVRIHAFDVVNSDGIDLVHTSNAIISDCDIHTTDDAICLKSTIPEHTARNITITNCILRTLCNGIKIGTDTVGNFEDITISNIVIYNPDNDMKDATGGINLCAVDGGCVRNVNISNIVMHNVMCAFYLVSSCRTAQQEGIRTPRAGTMERISISNVRADGTRYTNFIIGHPDQPIRDVHLSSINIRKKAEFYSAPPAVAVPECANQYPNPFMFGSPDGGKDRENQKDGLPAYGLYLRDAREITVRDYQVESLQEDVRELAASERCAMVELTGIRSNLAAKTSEVRTKL